jgi:hypothetical protein
MWCPTTVQIPVSSGNDTVSADADGFCLVCSEGGVSLPCRHPAETASSAAKTDAADGRVVAGITLTGTFLVGSGGADHTPAPPP